MILELIRNNNSDITASTKIHSIDIVEYSTVQYSRVHTVQYCRVQ